MAASAALISSNDSSEEAARQGLRSHSCDFKGFRARLDHPEWMIAAPTCHGRRVCLVYGASALSSDRHILGYSELGYR